MAEIGKSGNGVGGTSYDTKSYDFPGVPYNESDFNERSKCPSQNKNVQDYSNPDEVRNCNLNGLIDLDQSKNNVRVKITEFLNKLIDLGVAGFRIDSAKYMWPKDISAIQSMTKDLPEGGRPFFYHDVNEE
jgi:alpha-amylase